MVLIDGMLYFLWGIPLVFTLPQGIHITGNRIFGPLPRNPTYLCLWEIQLGTIKTSLSIHDAHILSCAGRSFGVTMSDAVNAPAAEYVLPSDPDGAPPCTTTHS